MTLDMAMVRMPCALALRKAASVSAVSPDWLTARNTAFSGAPSHTGAYRYSLAISAVVRTPANFSKSALPIMPAW